MSNELLGIIAFFILAFTWIVYIVQESFIAGASALNMSICKNEGERKQIQVISGLHFDGMEVWFIAAEALTFAAFPLAFATILEFLYVPVFLVVYALIARGVTIEVLYKLDSPKWIKANTIAWTISSFMLLLLFGVYLTNFFYGFPFDGNSMTESFLALFNVSTVSGGLLFVAVGLVSGAAWISMKTEGVLGERALGFVKKIGVIYTLPIFILMAYMGMNNLDTSIFIGELYTKSYLFFIVPFLAVVFAILTTYSSVKQNEKGMFIFPLLTVGLYLLSGFLGKFPDLVHSKIATDASLTIYETMATSTPLMIIFIAVLIFYPIIIFYQGWKYKKFNARVKFDDEV